MSTNSDLKDLMVAAANTITVSAEKLLCLSAIDQWYVAKTAADSAAADTISSYTIGDRSVTKRDQKIVVNNERDLFENLMQWPEIQALFSKRGSGVVSMSEPEYPDALV